MISGSGYNTNPQDVMWFCHLCQRSGLLPAGAYHKCEPASPAEERAGEEWLRFDWRPDENGGYWLKFRNGHERRANATERQLIDALASERRRADEAEAKLERVRTLLAPLSPDDYYPHIPDRDGPDFNLFDELRAASSSPPTDQS